MIIIMEKNIFPFPYLIFLPLIIIIMHQYSSPFPFITAQTTTGTTTTTAADEQSSLLSLKDYVTPDSFQILSTNWSLSSSSLTTTTTTTTNSCKEYWIGVTCDSRNRNIIGLNISNMGLKGTIPPDFGNLSFLISLDLSGNNFSGDFPVELSKLEKLRVLNLNSNNFAGEIPSWIDSLKNLEILYLDRNKLTGYIPPSIFNLTGLVELKLANNVLIGSIPAEIGKLRKLNTLAFGFNLFTGELPPEIFNISSLEYIWLSETVLYGSLPKNACDKIGKVKAVDLSRTKLNGPILSILSNCTKIEWLGLANCGFGGNIPQQIGNLKALKTMYLGNNNLTGEIPSGFSNLTMLETMSISQNQLTGIPREVYNMSSLKEIVLMSNMISGKIPDGICDSLPRLRMLSLGVNMIKGIIPPSISRCSSLETLMLTSNQLTGFIPKEIGQMSKLWRFFSSYNHLSGFIPREIGNISTLEVIELMSNFLTGTIPQELGNLSNLKKLYLRRNDLRGPFPMDALANCKNLTHLHISSNSINGPIPDSIGNLSVNLIELQAFSCGFNGTIPQTIGNLVGLVNLDLTSNMLTGSVPTTMKFLTKLQILQLENNKLNGEVFDDGRICSLQSLYELDLKQNQIPGEIHECLGQKLPLLRYIYLNSNRFNGSLPNSLLNLTNLLELNVSTNFLMGTLPNELGNKIKDVVSLDLSRNNIKGNLPISLGQLRNLQTLNLDHNQIEGSIPETIGEMVNLGNLDLSSNGLSGSIPKSLEKLQLLKYLNLSFNNLTGEIPSGGPFGNLSSEVFAFNRDLCGATKFGIPPCPIVTTSNQEKTLPFKRISRQSVIKYALVAIGTIVVLFVLVAIYIGHKTKNRVSRIGLFSSSFKGHERISYYDLLRATNGYDETNFLGKGSFGTVYKGTLDDGRVLAIKVFHPQFEKSFDSFDLECQVLRDLRHRNLTRVISSCCNPNFKALVLEFMPNGNLEKWLYSHNYFLDFVQRLNIMIDVANALHYLHFEINSSTGPIVHCDLKPSNILLDQDMVAHLTDFGIAKMLGQDDSFTVTETLATVGYLAPEYGLEGLVSTSCDVYSYGIMLMEVFTRVKPDNEMFGENLNLKSWISDDFPNSLADKIDGNLLVTTNTNANYSDHDQEIYYCISLIMEVALNCTKESSRERNTMKDVILSMEKIKLQLLKHTHV